MTTICPCFIWDEKIEKIFHENGILAFQGNFAQRIPNVSNNGIKVKYNYFGKKNKFGQYYFTRNSHFEPSLFNSSEIIDKVMKDIKIAFKHNVPAIIGTHRLNYVGRICTNNRDKNLKLLNSLLKNITDNYPDVEFLSSDQLISLLNK